MLGTEQEYAQSRAVLRYVYRTVGEFRFPLRLRGYWLTMSIAPGIEPASIWDAGCGLGHTAFNLARRFRLAQVIGTDINPNAIDHCRQIAERAHQSNVRFLVQDLAEPGSDNVEKYDLITCFEVLEHIVDFEPVLANFARQLAPGGRLIIHTPAAGRFQAATFGLRRFRRASTEITRERGQYHVRSGFILPDLIKSVEHNGLQVDHAQFTFGPATMLAHTVYELTRSRSSATAAAFPFLMLVARLDARRDHSEGGGILLRARKTKDSYAPPSGRDRPQP